MPKSHKNTHVRNFIIGNATGGLLLQAMALFFSTKQSVDYALGNGYARAHLGETIAHDAAVSVVAWPAAWICYSLLYVVIASGSRLKESAFVTNVVLPIASVVAVLFLFAIYLAFNVKIQF